MYVRHWYNPAYPYGTQTRILSVHRTVTDAQILFHKGIPDHLPCCGGELTFMPAVLAEHMWTLDYPLQGTHDDAGKMHRLTMKGDWWYRVLPEGTLIVKIDWAPIKGWNHYLHDLSLGKPRLMSNEDAYDY